MYTPASTHTQPPTYARLHFAKGHTVAYLLLYRSYRNSLSATAAASSVLNYRLLYYTILYYGYGDTVVDKCKSFWMKVSTKCKIKTILYCNILCIAWPLSLGRQGNFCIYSAFHTQTNSMCFTQVKAINSRFYSRFPFYPQSQSQE